MSQPSAEEIAKKAHAPPPRRCCSPTRVSPLRAAPQRPWTTEEDDTVRRLVQVHGTAWSLMAAQLQGRTGKQCRERWHNHLNPNISKEVRGLLEPVVALSYS